MAKQIFAGGPFNATVLHVQENELPEQIHASYEDRREVVYQMAPRAARGDRSTRGHFPIARPGRGGVA